MTTFFVRNDDGTEIQLVPVTGASVSMDKPASITIGRFSPTGPINLLAAQVQAFETVGAGNGPCKAIIHVVPGLPAIVTATFGPALGTNYTPMHASIAGTALPERGNGTAGGMLALGLNGAPGADINLTTGDHELVISNASVGDKSEKRVQFTIQP